MSDETQNKIVGNCPECGAAIYSGKVNASGVPESIHSCDCKQKKKAQQEPGMRKYGCCGGKCCT